MKKEREIVEDRRREREKEGKRGRGREGKIVVTNKSYDEPERKAEERIGPVMQNDAFILLIVLDWLNHHPVKLIGLITERKSSVNFYFHPSFDFRNKNTMVYVKFSTSTG